MKKIIQYIKHNVTHKISFWKWETLKKVLKEYGPTFLTILIIVELTEHVGGLLLIRWLGVNISEYFNVLLPAPFIFCFHWLTAPIVFFIYMKILKKKKTEHDN